MNLSTGVKNFIEENIELLDREDFQEFDDRAGMQTYENGYTKGGLYEVLLRSGINPLPYLPFVPFGFLRDTTLEGSLTIPGNCIDVRSRAFYNCNLSEIIFEDGVKSIKALACARSDKLEKVYIPSSMLNLGHGIFIGCNNMREIVYDGTYAEFNRLYSHTSEPNPWFGSIAGLASTNCILKCKDQDISLRIDI